MKTDAITFAGFYIVPYYVRGRAITIFLEPEKCYFSPQVWEIVVILHTSFQCLGTPAERYSDCISFVGRRQLLGHLDYGHISI